MAKIKEEKKEDVLTSQEQIDQYLKDNKEFHYNEVSPTEYNISSGSIIFDQAIGGGLKPGIIRLCGCSESGKSSSVLTFSANFQNTVTNSKVIYIKAEGRLSDEIKNRAGLNLSSEKWFEFKTNVYETAIGLIRTLVKFNPSNTKYFFIIDSMDALLPKVDLERGLEEANKVSGGALLTSDFLRRMALAMNTHGHICALISQVRSAIKINQYEKTDPRMTNAGGGNAALHYSDWIFEFQERFNKDIIWAGEEGKSDRIGHYCKIIFRKTPNETTGMTIRYPIKYKQINGKSIWREYEITDKLLELEMMASKGAWIDFHSDTITKAKNKGIELEPKHNGIKRFRDYLENNPNVTEYFYNLFTTETDTSETI